MEKTKGVELLSPAGDMEKLIMAVSYGADAVYMAGEEFGMRAAAGNFAGEEMEKAIAYCHSRGVKAYVTLNIVAANGEIERIGAYAEKLYRYGADAAIISDPGVFSVVRERAPGLELHMSTQAGVANYRAARFWYELGARRVVLARELSLDEIREIRANTPQDLTLECFVHGAMCVSFSGRCLISSYMAGRDANRGECTQPCRWKYYLREEKREGEYYELEESAEGTYFFNSKDLCTVDFLDKIIECGVGSLKIEGRAKSAYYAAAVTGAYRGALDDLLAGRGLDGRWREELMKVSHRRYCNGFFFGKGSESMQHYGDSSYIREWDICAFVTGRDGDRSVLLQKNRFSSGEEAELLSPDGRLASFVIGEILHDGEVTATALHPHSEYTVKLPFDPPEYSIIRKQVSQNIK
ncbi:MAG: U32 family peptidase [Oscillospiraceae bacterium]|jgi:putative protease|nr:U32 family peptidase [Oscillospiraceae bacterium]